jgi:hypothetical protein
MLKARIVFWFGLAIALVGLGFYYDFDMKWPDFGVGDWMSYWSIPHSLLRGHGYYDLPWLQALQGTLGWNESTYYQTRDYPIRLLWNPPPLILVLLPLGGLSFSLSLLVWIGLSALLYFHAASLFNRHLLHPLPEGVVLGVTFLFVPFLASMFWGQVPPVLVALLIYAWLAQRRGQWIAAGVLLTPLLLKPHLLFIAILLIFLVALRRRQWRLLVAFVGAQTFLLISSFMMDPTWIEGWLGQGTPAEWYTLSLVDMIRSGFVLPGWTRWIGIPIGILVALWRYRHVQEITPRLLGEAVLLSVLFRPYVWHHDVVVLLPAALWLATWVWQNVRLRGLLVAQTAFNVWLMPWADLNVLRYLLYLCTFLLWWIWAGREAAAPHDTHPVPLSAPLPSKGT